MIPLQLAWCRETSADPEGWSESRPSHGQCAVTALFIQDLLGGDLLRTVNEGVSHYWNRLRDGTEIDLTRDQFARWEPGEIEVRTRGYAISFEPTVRRYRILLDQIGLGGGAHDPRCASLLGQGCDCRSPWAGQCTCDKPSDDITTSHRPWCGEPDRTAQ